MKRYVVCVAIVFGIASTGLAQRIGKLNMQVGQRESTAQVVQKWNSYELPDASLDSTDFTPELLPYDLTQLWVNKRWARIGFNGDNYQRFDIYFNSLGRDSVDRSIYHVTGKTRVRKNICSFEGTIQLIAARKLTNTPKDRDGASLDTLERGIALCTYRFLEDRKQKFSGIFEGQVTTIWFIDPRKNLHYDDIDMQFSDRYYNNAFLGTWKSYDNRLVKPCSWGDCRIPDSGDLDVGEGEFYPNPKYLKNGWSTFGHGTEKVWWK